jgi:hypothetical protein
MWASMKPGASVVPCKSRISVASVPCSDAIRPPTTATWASDWLRVNTLMTRALRISKSAGSSPLATAINLGSVRAITAAGYQDTGEQSRSPSDKCFRTKISGCVGSPKLWGGGLCGGGLRRARTPGRNQEQKIVDIGVTIAIAVAISVLLICRE